MISSKKQKNNTPEKKCHHFKLYFRLLLLILLAIVALIIYFIWQFLQKPSSGRVYTSQSSSATVTSETFERFEGKYFSFRYNQRYAIKSHIEEPQNGGVILESALLSNSEIVSKRIALTVETLQGRTMADSGNFNMRKKSPKDYQEENVEIEKNKIVTFISKKSDSFEEVFFISRGTYLAEIGFSGPSDAGDDFKAEISDIIKSIQWKK